MASQRAYARMHGHPYSGTIAKDQRGKRVASIQRARQIRDSMAAASLAFRPGGWQRNTPTAMFKEKKVIDLVAAVYAFTIPTAPPTPTLLNGCIAGSQNYNRIGRKINMKSLQFRGMIAAATVATAADDQLCRIVIVYDKQSNGAAPTWANVVQSQSIAGTTSSATSDMVNLDNRDRFTIVRDKFFPMAAQVPTATQAAMGSQTV